MVRRAARHHARHPIRSGEVEYRQLDDEEVALCHRAAVQGGMPASELQSSDMAAADSLHRRGLLWVDVPIRPEDQISIPPLEGFVSNRTSTTDAVDPLETLLYQVPGAGSVWGRE